MQDFWTKINIIKINVFCEYNEWQVPKSDFQNEFAMPRVIQIIPIKDNLFILFTKYSYFLWSCLFLAKSLAF